MKKTVMLVDDSMVIKKYLANLLLENKYNVIAEASNGQDAISLYKEVNPEIVLLDLILPDINGTDVLKTLLDIDANAKVVICSSMSQSFFITEAINWERMAPDC